MENKLGILLSDFGIFTSESFIGNKIFIIGLFILSIIIIVIEYYSQTSMLSVFSILKGNTLYFCLAWLLLFTFEFISSWRSRWLGGESAAIIVLTIAAFLILLFLKKYTFTVLEMQFRHPYLLACLPVMIILIPVILFSVYVYMLGSAWQN